MTTEMTMRDGMAQPMGEGVFVLCQTDAERGPQSVVVTLADILSLAAQAGAGEGSTNE